VHVLLTVGGKQTWTYVIEDMLLIRGVLQATPKRKWPVCDCDQWWRKHTVYMCTATTCSRCWDLVSAVL